MTQPPARSIIGMIFRNFINSFRPRQIIGNLKGTDYFGTRYYEIAADPSRGKRRPSRWFVPVDKENFEQEMPAEWEAWLRGRRKEPPTKEELEYNLALMKKKQQMAIEVDEKAQVKTPMRKGMETFPTRPEYEIMPGKPQKE